MKPVDASTPRNIELVILTRSGRRCAYGILKEVAPSQWAWIYRRKVGDGHEDIVLKEAPTHWRLPSRWRETRGTNIPTNVPLDVITHDGEHSEWVLKTKPAIRWIDSVGMVRQPPKYWKPHHMKSKTAALQLTPVLAPTRKEVWVASDGSTHEDIMQAKLVEEAIAFEAFVDKVLERVGYPISAPAIRGMVERGGHMFVEAIKRYHAVHLKVTAPDDDEDC